MKNHYPPPDEKIELTPEPTSESAPEPEPTSEPVLEPEPTSEPALEPEPTSESAPEPEPTSEPVPELEPDSIEFEPLPAFELDSALDSGTDPLEPDLPAEAVAQSDAQPEVIEQAAEGDEPSIDFSQSGFRAWQISGGGKFEVNKPSLVICDLPFGYTLDDVTGVGPDSEILSVEIESENPFKNEVYLT